MVRRAFNLLLSVFLLGFLLETGEGSACTSHHPEPISQHTTVPPHSQHESHPVDGCQMECCKKKGGDSSECNGSCGTMSCQSSSQTACVLQTDSHPNNALKFEGRDLFPSYRHLYSYSAIASIWQPPKMS